MSGILFICTANACRSQMAEAFAGHVLPPDVPVFSAGTRPSTVDARAVQVMSELGIDISAQRSKSIDDIPLGGVRHVITLCGDAAEHCPVIPDARREHWPLPDPAEADGSSNDVLAVFRAVRDEIFARVRMLDASFRPEPAVGVIGGSGFYDLPGLTETSAHDVDTPFGRPSSPLVTGRLNGRRVVFLARHGERHRLLPGEVNARANLYALKRLGVTKLISISAVG